MGYVHLCSIDILNYQRVWPIIVQSNMMGTHLRKNEQLTMSHQDMFCLTTSVSHTASKTGVLESVPSSPTWLSWCLSCFFGFVDVNYDI